MCALVTGVQSCALPIYMASSPITFWAKAVGDITVSQLDNGLIEMNFPNRAPTPVTNVPPALLQGLSIPPAQVLKNQQAYIAVYESQDDVTNVVPDLEQLKKLAPLDLAVTAPGDRQIGRASCRERVCQYV